MCVCGGHQSDVPSSLSGNVDGCFRNLEQFQSISHDGCDGSPACSHCARPDHGTEEAIGEGATEPRERQHLLSETKNSELEAFHQM